MSYRTRHIQWLHDNKLPKPMFNDRIDGGYSLKWFGKPDDEINDIMDYMISAGFNVTSKVSPPAQHICALGGNFLRLHVMDR